MSRYEVRRALTYRPEQLFDLAADVERYPEFLPGWIAARVRKHEGDVYYTDQIVALAMIRQRFQSKTMLRRPERIDVTSTDRTFSRFHLVWLFEPQPDIGCQVALAVEIELRSALIQDLFHRAIGRMVRSIMSAFESRAQRLYGPSANPCSSEKPGGSSDPGT